MKILFFAIIATFGYWATAAHCHLPKPNTAPVTPVSTTANSGAVTANSTINPDNFDADLLASLVQDKINALRTSKTRCKALKKDEVLAAAALEQSNYVTQKGSLSHEQAGNKSKHTVLDRVKLFGGGFSPVGENLLFQGFKKRTYDTGKVVVLYPTYDEIATQMVKGWQKSKPHYSNIIECDFTHGAVAVTYSAQKEGVFAAQVFGGK